MHTVIFKKNRLLSNDQRLLVRDGTSLLEAARQHNVPMGERVDPIDRGTGSHCYVVAGMENLSEIDTLEDELLDRSHYVTETSRLGVFARVHGDVTVIVTDESLNAWQREATDMPVSRVA